MRRTDRADGSRRRNRTNGATGRRTPRTPAAAEDLGLLTLQRELTAGLVENRGIDGVAETLHRVTGRHVTIEDANGNLLSWTTTVRPAPRPEGVSRKDSRLPSADDVHGLRRGDYVVAAIRHAETLVGRVCLLDPDGTADPATVLALEEAALVLGLELLRTEAVARAELAMWGDLATEVLEGADPARCRGHARALGYDLDRPQRVAVVENVDEPGRPVLEALRRSAGHLDIGPHLVTSFGGRAVLLTAAEPRWATLADALADDAGVPCRIGVGGRHPPEEARRSLSEAGFAIRLTRSLGNPTPVAMFDDLGVWSVLAVNDDGAELRRFVAHWIGRLVDYDTTHGSELVNTLATYLRCAGALEQTATKLFIHRSTLRYRLGRIEHLSGWDLHDPEHRFNLDLACRAHLTMTL